MKRRKQCQLETFSYTTHYNPETKKTSGDDVRRASQVEKSIGISGLNDFLNQAERLADDLNGYGDIASEKTKTLKVLTQRLRKNIEGGADRHLINRTVHMALTFAALKNFESETEKGKKITMASYMAAKAISSKQVDIARQLGVSTEAVRRFERKNFGTKRKSR